jgi:hypothetical protein
MDSAASSSAVGRPTYCDFADVAWPQAAPELRADYLAELAKRKADLAKREAALLDNKAKAA